MPSFHDNTTAAAPPEEVWKLLYDPARFPDWWAGIDTVEPSDEPADPGAPTRYIIYLTERPDFPMPQRLQTIREDRRVVVSCLITDLRFAWQLESLQAGTATRISVHVDVPARDAHLLDTEREVITASLHRLATLASATSRS